MAQRSVSPSCVFFLSLFLVAMPGIAGAGSFETPKMSLTDVLVSWWYGLIGPEVLSPEELEGRCLVDPWGCPEAATTTPPPQTDARCGVDPWGCPGQ